jgi:RNA polymerase sigma-70 factor, ECF subfamily
VKSNVSLRLVPPAPSPAVPEPADLDPADLDPADLDQVFRRLAPYVARIGTRILGHSEEIDDLVQDVFLDAHRGLKGLRDANAVRHWLATITVRKAQRRLARRRLWRMIGLDRPGDASSVLDPSASAEERAWLVAIYRILDGVAPDARIAWVMHRIEKESLETIAELCKCSRATAHRRVQEAQAALERGLEDVEA